MKENSTAAPKAIVMDTTYYSIGFPILDESIIPRQNYLTQLDELFVNGTHIIYLEGEEDAGKTTLCGQYARKRPNNVISVFFNPFNNLDYSIDFFCSNMVYQLKHLVGETIELENEPQAGQEDYQKAVFQVRKKYKNRAEKITIVIDGLETLGKKKNEFISELFGMLPIGQEDFNFIISGSESDFKEYLLKTKQLSVKPISLMGFSSPEIELYLGPQSFATVDNAPLFKITKGFPGRLRTLKRLLETYKPEDIIQSATYKEWITLDCETVEETPISSGILSLLSFADKSFTVEEIAGILQVTIEEANQTLLTIKVLEKANGRFRFMSTAHKRHYHQLLRSNERTIQDLLIQYHNNNHNTESLIELPKLYAGKNDWSSVLRVLDEDYSRKIIDSTESVSNVSQNLKLGIQASEQLKQFPNMYRYSLEASMINELDNFLFWESEVKARIAIQDFAGAVSLAESAILKIDRLRLLTLIARKQKEIKDTVDEELVNLIHQLYETTDFILSGDKIFDIVADLIYAIPNLAIEMIEKSSGAAKDKNINDWVIAKLSVAAIDASIKAKEDPEKSKKVEALQMLNNPDVKKINKAISFMVGNYSGKKVIEEIKKLTEPTERLRLLRLWLTNHRGSDPELGKTINQAVDELVASSSKTSVSLDILKELSDQLPYVLDDKFKDTLYYRIKSLEKDMPDSGLTRNNIIYRLNMFHAEFTLDKKSAIKSLERIITGAEAITDTLIQLEAYAQCYVKIHFLGYDPLLSKEKFIYSRILSLSEILFESTASHLNLVHHTIKTIARHNPVLSLRIAGKINLQINREKARIVILDSYLQNTIIKIKTNLLEVICESFELATSLQQSHLHILERYAEAKTLPFKVIENIYPIFEELIKIKSPAILAYGYVQVFKIIGKNDKWRSRQLSRFASLIRKSFESIESEWEKIDTGFTICSDISNTDPKLARTIFDRTNELKKGSWIDSKPVAEAYILSVKLVIQAFAGLLLSDDFTTEDENIFSDLVNRIPSEIIKLDLWTELGFHAFLSEKTAFAEKIHNEHVTPLLAGIHQKDTPIRESINSLTYLYLFHSDLAHKYLNKLSPDLGELAYTNICQFYTSSYNPYEIYDYNVKNFHPNYTSLSKAVEVLKKINTDSTVFWQIDNITRAIIENKTNISKVQNATLLDSLSEIIKEKLPDINNIRHTGYQLLSEMKVNRARRELPASQLYWTDTIKQAESIPNLSDKIFVKYVLLEDTPFEKISNGAALKTSLYNDIVNHLKGLSSHYEFIERVNHISEGMIKVNRTHWKEIIRKAFTVCNKLEEGAETYKSQRNIIDTMYRMDPDYARELIKLSTAEKDDFKYNEQLGKHLEFLEIANKIKNNKTLEQKEKENYRMIVRSIVNTMGSINSHKIAAKKVAEASAYLGLGDKLPLHDVFPVHVYYLSNCAKTYKVTGKGMADIHRDNFKKAVKATNLIELLSYRKKGVERNFRQFFIDEEFSSNKAVNPGSKEEAFLFIKEWMNESVTDYLTIADPYFVKEDLEILKMINQVNPDLAINILGSKNGADPDIEKTFKEQWNSISDQLPPFTHVTFCWIPETGNSKPFHDRWLLTKNSGMRIGTSLNSLGISKESELSIMNAGEALTIKERSISEYISGKKRTVNGTRLVYKSFSL